MKALKRIIACVLLLLLVFPAVTVGALSENEYDYVLDRDNAEIRVPIPKAYVMTATYLHFGEAVGTLNDVSLGSDIYLSALGSRISYGRLMGLILLSSIYS